jgi:hypothetical protein
MWSGLPKNQKLVSTFCYSPYDDTPPATTVAVMTDGVALWSCIVRERMEIKKNIFEN